MGVKPIAQDKDVCPGHKNAELKPSHLLFFTDQLCHPCIWQTEKEICQMLFSYFFFFS